MADGVVQSRITTICPTSRRRSEWSFAISMFWDTGRAIKPTMRAGAKLKSRCMRLKVCRRLTSTQKPATTPLPTEPIGIHMTRVSLLVMLLCAFVFAPLPASAQLAITLPQPVPPGQESSAEKQGSSIKVQVNLVVLHTTVLDDRGRFADGLKQENFRILEDKIEQKLSVFKREDVPVSMGLVIDNSGSMRDKRPRVNEAAITLVESSNPQDEAFVVNFNDDFYLDLDKDFTNSIPELKEALERIDSRGSTALYDPIIGSLDPVQKGTHAQNDPPAATHADTTTPHTPPQQP